VLLSVVAVAGVLGLAHAPAAALRLALTSTLPACVVYLALDGARLWPMVLVLAVANLTVLVMTFGFHADFVRLELSRQQLARRERLAARLAETNFEQASRDALTGALNRRAILARLGLHMAQDRGGEGQAQPWLALLDLDGFKHINDTYGHAAGDDVLRAVATRIGAIAGVMAHGRLGGDEFAILFHGGLDGPGVAARRTNWPSPCACRWCTTASACACMRRPASIACAGRMSAPASNAPMRRSTRRRSAAMAPSCCSGRKTKWRCSTAAP
jgi:GGDEF domain-containing protein